MYGPDPKTLNSVNRERLMGKSVHNKIIFKSTSHKRGYKDNCLSSFSPGTIFCFCCGQEHKNISDSKNVKSNVKFHSFKTAVLTAETHSDRQTLANLLLHVLLCFVFQVPYKEVLTEKKKKLKEHSTFLYMIASPPKGSQEQHCCLLQAEN